MHLTNLKLVKFFVVSVASLEIYSKYVHKMQNKIIKTKGKHKKIKAIEMYE
jgi:hypothetical protein